MFQTVLINLIFLSTIYAFLPFLVIILLLTQIGRIRTGRLTTRIKRRPAPIIE